jgi:hypothetical protein
MMFPTGIAKPVYRIRTRTSNPATGRALDTPLEDAAMVLEQSFITSVTTKVNKKYAL